MKKKVMKHKKGENEALREQANNPKQVLSVKIQG
jgi:hypothetical protein